MSETQQVTLTCDFCGKTHDRRHQMDGAGHQSWFRIASEKLQAWPEAGSYIGITSTLTMTDRMPRDPDLCSWECVAGYAQRQAELLAAQVAKQMEARR